MDYGIYPNPTSVNITTKGRANLFREIDPTALGPVSRSAPVQPSKPTPALP